MLELGELLLEYVLGLALRELLIEPGAMAKMMSLKAEQEAAKDATEQTKPPADTKSFHEKQAESKGKKTEKGTEPDTKKRRR